MRYDLALEVYPGVSGLAAGWRNVTMHSEELPTGIFILPQPRFHRTPGIIGYRLGSVSAVTHTASATRNAKPPSDPLSARRCNGLDLPRSQAV